MRIVSLFSGVGGLDIACERAFNGKTIVQVEREPFALRVLERRWPDVRRHDDVMTYRGEDCEVIAGGFPCTDLSVAGKREGLDAARSGLYHEMMRIVGEALPQYVVVENVPPLLKYRGRLDTDFARLGYGTIWQVCEASDVGAPHRRQRVFIVAVRGLAGSQMLPRPSVQVDLFLPVFGGDKADAVLWGTPRSSMRSPNQDRNKGNLEDHVFRHDVLWPTPTVCGNNNRTGSSAKAGDGLATAVKTWPTPAARDYKDSGHEPSAQARNSPCLPASAVMDADQAPGVLNPHWVELLMGLPAGWTAQTRTKDLPSHLWPAGRGEPQHEGEPPRLVPRKSVANRGARLKALGNAVVWQQAEAAIRRALEVAR
jgi:DNA (cytosine-5)-methyltransferase 1